MVRSVRIQAVDGSCIINIVHVQYLVQWFDVRK